MFPQVPPFVDDDISAGNRVDAVWLNAVNAAAGTTLPALAVIVAAINSAYVSKTLIAAAGDYFVGTANDTVGILPAAADVAANATTSNIWAARVNTLTGGAVTFTNFAAASYAGQVSWVISNAAHILTNAAPLSVQGNTGYTLATGDILLVCALTTTTFRILIFPASGLPVVTPTVSIPTVWGSSQTVLTGPTNSDGSPNVGGATGATSITLAGTFVLAAAGGYTTAGLVSRIGSITNPQFTGLSTNGTMYLYYDISSLGVVSVGSTTLAPKYIAGGTPDITNGQFSFDRTLGIGYLGDGATTAQVYRVFFGQVTVAGAVVTAITPYAYRGQYSPAFTATLPAVSTPTSKNHNLGYYPDEYFGEFECTTADGGFAVGDRIRMAQGFAGGGNFANIAPLTTKLLMTFIVPNNGANSGFYTFSPTTGLTLPLTAASWKWRLVASVNYLKSVGA